MSLDPGLRALLLARSQACGLLRFSLSGNVHRADDLVQDTLLPALANIHRFEPGTT